MALRFAWPVRASRVSAAARAVIFSWFCYGYIPHRQTRIAVLRNVTPHLKPGGRVLISYVPAEGTPRFLPIGLTRLATRLTRSDWRPELGDVLGPITADRRSVRYEHMFLEGELENEARAAGLTMVFHERSEVVFSPEIVVVEIRHQCAASYRLQRVVARAGAPITVVRGEVPVADAFVLDLCDYRVDAVAVVADHQHLQILVALRQDARDGLTHCSGLEIESGLPT